MNNPDLAKISDLKVDQKNLYREEVFTDMKFATIRQLTPVLPDGQRDDRRNILYFGHTQIMTPGGALPLQFEIDAKSLKQAMDLFPNAVKKAFEELVEEMKEAQRQSESRIVVPGNPPGSKIMMP
ncbi:MAG: hypothetical protein WDA72_04130 [Desulfomonilia bacterium]|nr:hypothetical protein [Deltaproteobacteria bacterium]MDX9762307.1 hypothetical protein [Desulfomonilia bacterium]HPW69344.1 hypothetical protein [Deltaproteobacteria bacterium]